MKMVMTASPKTQMSLQDYLQFEDQTDNLYELDAGTLRQLNPFTESNCRITSFLICYFSKSGVSHHYLRIKTEIVVMGERETVRVPDLMVLSEEAAIALENATRSTIMPDMPPPELVIEVVSPGRENINRDYRYKRAQYQARGINEYWIVDPIEQKITILTMNEGLYDEIVFQEKEVINSLFLKNITSENPVTAAEILQINVS